MKIKPSAAGIVNTLAGFNSKSKRWYLIAAYGLIWLAVSIVFVVLYGVDITAEAIMRNIFPIRIAIILGALMNAVLISTLLHLYFRKLKLLEERDRLVAETRGALAQVTVKTLRGLLSVCSYCKKVRNHEGDWEQIEAYVTNNSHAEFTHGVCPECLAMRQGSRRELHFRKVAMIADKKNYVTGVST